MPERRNALTTLAAVGPNVVIVVLDTARADAFEPYGAAPGASPVLADLAASGAAMPLAYAPSNWTVPSHASMFTGMLPLDMGFGRSGVPWGQECRSILEAHVDRNLVCTLQDAGYATYGVSANAWIRPRTGFGLGFDDFRIARGRRYEGVNETSVKARLKWARQAVLARIDDGAANAAHVIEQWLDALDRDRPFFLFVNLVECHSPYLPPAPWASLSPWQRFLAGEEARRHLTLTEIFRVNAGGFDVPDGAIERMRAGYADAVRMMDGWVGRLTEALADRGLLYETFVAVTSDHGENLGENDQLCHAMSLSDRLVRVPLVVHGPGAEVVDRPMSLTEVPAMVAAVAGIEDHPWAEDRVGGPIVAQHDGPFRHNPTAAADFVHEHGLGVDGARRMTRREACATDGRHKLVRGDDGSASLYDLLADPMELAPETVTAATEVPPELVQALDDADASAALAVGGSGEVDELDELEGQLRLLGYL